eukprot:UN00340
MEMYADNNATGGVLEPEGIVDVKFKREQILAETRDCEAFYWRVNAKQYEQEYVNIIFSTIRFTFIIII